MLSNEQLVARYGDLIAPDSDADVLRVVGELDAAATAAAEAVRPPAGLKEAIERMSREHSQTAAPKPPPSSHAHNGRRPWQQDSAIADRDAALNIGPSSAAARGGWPAAHAEQTTIPLPQRTGVRARLRQVVGIAAAVLVFAMVAIVLAQIFGAGGGDDGQQAAPVDATPTMVATPSPSPFVPAGIEPPPSYAIIEPPDAFFQTLQGGQVEALRGSYHWVDMQRYMGADNTSSTIPLGDVVAWPVDDVGQVTIGEAEQFDVASITLAFFDYTANVTQMPGTTILSFVPETEPETRIDLPTSDPSLIPPVPPGMYVIEVTVRWDLPDGFELPAGSRDDFFAQYAFAVEITPSRDVTIADAIAALPEGERGCGATPVGFRDDTGSGNQVDGRIVIGDPETSALVLQYGRFDGPDSRVIRVGQDTLGMWVIEGQQGDLSIESLTNLDTGVSLRPVAEPIGGQGTWGTVVNFPEPGCWQAVVAQGDAVGILWLDVLPSSNDEEDCCPYTTIGTITEIASGTILVVERPDDPAGGEQYYAAFDTTTRVVEWTASGSESRTTSDLEVGDRVMVTFEGPIADSYPAKGRAHDVAILRTSTDGPVDLEDLVHVTFSLSLYTGYADRSPAEDTFYLEYVDVTGDTVRHVYCGREPTAPVLCEGSGMGYEVVVSAPRGSELQATVYRVSGPAHDFVEEGARFREVVDTDMVTRVHYRYFASDPWGYR